MIPINVVLVRSKFSRNIGSVSRVMANMNGGRLILISPQCKYDLDARQGAAGAQTHLLERTEYKDWAEFFKSEPEGIRISFCARKKNVSDLETFETRIEKISKKFNSLQHKSFYFIFGPEDQGLNNSDIELSNYICQLPTFGKFKSLNLSHAVLLALYIAQNKLNPLRNNNMIETPFVFPEEALKKWLTTLGFTIGERKKDAFKTLKRILLQNLATSRDLKILEAIIFQTIRKINNSNDQANTKP